MLFCNINFNIKNHEDLFSRIGNQTKCILPVNAQLIVLANTIPRYLEIMNENYVCFDGVPPLFIAKRKKSEFNSFFKLSGSDIVYDFCAYAKQNDLKLFFLGGGEDSNSLAIENIRAKYDIKIYGYSPQFEEYPFSDIFLNNCYAKLAEVKPDILFVGFGAPKQEFFIHDSKFFLNEIGIKYVIACGGTFDFISGKIRRASKFISKIGFESIYRLVKEPNLVRFKRIIQSLKFYKYVHHKPDFRLDYEN